MDRMEDYAALQAQLEEHPSALAYTVQRARARRARRRRLRRFGVPLGSLAGAMALFVLLVNLSAPFALACSHIPVLKELAAAVSFSPTLSTAVEHDYAQRIDQTQSANGVTMTLNYLMADPAQLIFFVTVTGPEDASLMELRPELKGPDGEELEGFSLMSSSVAPGELSNAITAAIGTEDFAFPETLRLDCEVRAYLPGVTDPESWTPDARFTFEFPLDARFREQGRALALDRWVELDGNRIRLVSLELYPTHARLNLEQDPDNAEQLQTLDFYLEDENGVRYEKGSASGLASMGDTYLCESPFFRDPKHLTLHITQATWLAPEREYVALDLERGTALDALPEDMHLSVHRIGRQVGLALIAPDPPGNTETFHASYQLFGGHYRSPDGETHDLNCSSTISSGGLWWGTEDETELPEGYFATELILEDYPWDTVELALYFSRRTEFPVPVAFDLT